MKKLKYLPFLIPLPILIFIFLIFKTESGYDEADAQHIIIEYEMDSHSNGHHKRKLHKRNSEAFSYGDVKVIEVNGKSTSVLVTASDNGATSFSQSHSKSGNYSLIHEKQGDKLKIWVKTKGGKNGSPLELQIPNDINLVVYNTSGNIHLSEINSSNISLKTTSGNIINENVNAPISAKSASGNVLMKDVNGNLSIITASGNQKIVDTNGDMEIVSASGNIFINESEGIVNIVTASGDIKAHELRIKDDASFVSVSGDIDVYFSNYINKLDFDLTSLSGDLKVGHSESEKQLKIQNQGTIRVKGKTLSGSQDYQ